MNRRHTKVPGFVEWVDGPRWGGRLFVDDRELHAEFGQRLPLLSGMGEGHFFTIHTTKRGQTYLYWIKEPRLTKRDLIKAKQEARRLGKALGLPWAA